MLDPSYTNFNHVILLLRSVQHGGNNSMAANWNYTCFVHFVPERNVLVFASASCGVGKLITL